MLSPFILSSSVRLHTKSTNSWSLECTLRRLQTSIRIVNNNLEIDR